jgi:aspartate/methionine/tyrosine aminotransferase
VTLAPFALERFFARHEFTARLLLCSSDPESMTVGDLCALEPGTREALDRVWLGYGDSRGQPALRAAIAGLHEPGGCGPDDIVVHVGSQEPIFTFMHAQVTAGDEVIVHVPAYQSQTELPRALGATVVPWRGHPALDPDDLVRLISPRTRGLVVCTPHNPTGEHLDHARLARVIELARRHGLWLLGDEVYRGLEHAGRGARLPSVADLYERAAAVGGTAKGMGLPGLRVGWLSTRDAELRARVGAIKDYTTICGSQPAELLAAVACRHAETLWSRSLARISENLEHCDAFFARHADRFTWRRPRGGTTVLVGLRHESAEAFAELVLAKSGVLVAPGPLFGAPDDCFRLGYGRANLPEALAALGTVLQS